MTESIRELSPFRWKVRLPFVTLCPYHHTYPQVFQVLLLDSENTGCETGSLRDARHLVITSERFNAFVDKHKELDCLVPGEAFWIGN